jgi:cell division protein FtsL
MKKTIAIVAIVLLVVIGLSIVQVSVANMISTKGIELSKMEQAISNYKRQNALMKEKILERSSFTEIASKAGELGFVPSKSNIYLTSPLPLAKR